MPHGSTAAILPVQLGQYPVETCVLAIAYLCETHDPPLVQQEQTQKKVAVVATYPELKSNKDL